MLFEGYLSSAASELPKVAQFRSVVDTTSRLSVSPVFVNRVRIRFIASFIASFLLISLTLFSALVPIVIEADLQNSKNNSSESIIKKVEEMFRESSFLELLAKPSGSGLDFLGSLCTLVKQVASPVVAHTNSNFKGLHFPTHQDPRLYWSSDSSPPAS